MTATGEQDYAKEEFLNLMKVALVDSNQRIILSDKNLCTEYRENEGDDNENRVEFNDATIEPKKNLMEEQMQNMQKLENENNHQYPS